MNYRNMLQKSGAIRKGHFVYNSGRHGSLYVNKTAGLVHVSDARVYARAIADEFDHVEVVVGPELGAVTLMAHVAGCLLDTRPRSEVDEIVATKVVGTKDFEIARDQARFLKNRHVLVVEDILTTGTSVASVVNAVRTNGGIVLGVGALWNRGQVTAEDLGVPKLYSVIDDRIDDFAPKDCPQCKMNIPITTGFGKG